MSIEQIKASDPGYCVYVSASAGTGKTKVLIDRIIRILILGKSKLKNILCITFTQSAALEIKTRLIEKLKFYSLCEYNELEVELALISGKKPSITELEMAKSLYADFLCFPDLEICTLHSFCLRLLKDYSEQSFDKIINEADHRRLVNLSISSITYDAQKDGMGKNALYSYVEDVIKNTKLSSIDISNQRFEELSMGMERVLGFKLFKKKDLLKTYYTNLRLDNLVRACNAIIDAGNTEPLLQTMLSFIESKRFRSNFKEYAGIFLTKSGDVRKNFLKKSVILNYPDEYNIIYSHKNETIECLLKLCAMEAGERSLRCFYLGLKALKVYNFVKNKEGFIDYDDILIEANRLLNESHSSSWVQMNVDAKIDHVLVDEAQDLNEIQWSIIKTITAEFFSGQGARQIERTIFIVGDYKQSIFGFQGARPGIFNDICSYYREAALNAGKNWRELALNSSYRTAQTILDSVNIFLQSNQVGTKYDKQVSYNGKLDGEFIERYITNQKENIDSWLIPGLNKKSDHADEIANALLIEVKKTLNELNINLGEIMILLRKRGSLQEKIISLFLQNGINITSYSANKLQDYPIISDFISALKFISNPKDYLSLVVLLKSKIFMVEENEIYILCKDNLLDNVKNYKPDLYLRLEKIRSFGKQNSIYNLLSLLLYQIIDRITSFEKALILNLLDIVKTFEKLGRAGIISFINWFSDLDASYKDDILDSRAIKLLTIHASKGMESNVVMIADFRDIMKVRAPEFIWVNGYKFVNLKHISYSDNIRPQVDSRKQLDLLESARLTYVAMTRARTRLIIIDHADAPNEK